MQTIREIGSWENAPATDKVAWIAKNVLHREVDWKPDLYGNNLVPYMLVDNWAGLGISAYVEISDPKHVDQWAYLTNPTADYEVLQAIRNNYSRDVYVRFSKELDQIHSARVTGGRQWQHLYTSSAYVVGDYSHAAFLTLRSVEAS